jgi:hypothetical protein
MAKVKLNAKIKEIKGMLGDVVFRVSPSGKIIVSKRPDMSNVKWSKAQKAQRQRFKQAAEYAKTALADPEVRAVYEKRAATEQRLPYRMALSDYFKGIDLLSKR